jgi:hypothetical protein
VLIDYPGFNLRLLPGCASVMHTLKYLLHRAASMGVSAKRIPQMAKHRSNGCGFSF